MLAWSLHTTGRVVETDNVRVHVEVGLEIIGFELAFPAIIGKSKKAVDFISWVAAKTILEALDQIVEEVAMSAHPMPV